VKFKAVSTKALLLLHLQADENGNINGELMSAQIEEKLRANLEGSPDVLDVLLNALASCTLPATVSVSSNFVA